MKKLVAVVLVLFHAIAGAGMSTYKVKVRVDGRISYIYPQAQSSSHAKSIAEAQIGKDGDVLEASKVREPEPKIPAYDVRFKINGRLSTDRVNARDASHAKALVKAKIGPDGYVLSASRVN